MDKAAVHMEPLCHRNFRPPDADDYGPCYHMAKGYQRAQRWEPAKDLFEFDCRRDAVSGHPSCQALEKMLILKEELRQAAWDRLRPVETAEGFLLLVVLMSLIHAVLWFKGGAGVLTWMIYGAPVVVWGGVLTWVYWPEKPEFPANQWAVVAFTLFLVCGLALVALYRKNFRPPSDSAFGKPPSDGISPTPAKG
ncbi:MAG: hypothetical protein GWM98_05320 [Nitrospinaceae bacterium]|nr:hypothetical protein [Nitrospinaceae bacterium]NIR53991.1 hypothetical protein [Nitrospinaceae bacterium]NIS84410.1 hypothetical protein [Nitrospinaceae bacterium]NIT81201.1 hypothetical protein [Nitrospinaceae bacterium]NIU43490.1 hypothetical protein [Nitrospinaceae bacterium]